LKTFRKLKNILWFERENTNGGIAFYYRGLKEYPLEKGYLINTCLSGQDKYKKVISYFKIKY